LKENRIINLQIPNAVRDKIVIEKSLDGDEEYWLQQAN
jgi:hypothetical protein